MLSEGEVEGRRPHYLYPSEGFDRSFAELFYLDIEEGDQTNASDYGIGAYLYILRKGVESIFKPFFSESTA
jgi:hypothetical protein